MQLVAPCVQIHRRIENSVRRAENQAAVIEAVRHAEARSETQLRGILQAARHAILTTDEGHQFAILLHDITPVALDVHQRRFEFVTHADIDRRG